MKEAKAQKKRNLDTFLQEIKKLVFNTKTRNCKMNGLINPMRYREQEDRQDRLRMRQAHAHTSTYTSSTSSNRESYRTPSAPPSTCILLSRLLKVYHLIEI